MADFTPSWRRPHRDNDVVPPSSSSSSSDVTSWWRRYPCLVCGKRELSPATNYEHENDPSKSSSSSSQHHKRCSRCHAVVYCSLQCQRHDYTHGKHKSSCIKIGKLREEKSTIEQQCLWYTTTSTTTNEKMEKSTNPFDDDHDDDDDDGINIPQYPIVGKFWHDHPSSETERATTRYCVILLQLAQLLGRGESWRVANTTTTNVDVHRHQCQTTLTEQPTTSILGRREGNNENNEHIGNPLAREIALDIALTLLHLDKTDMRIRLLVPSLLLESGYINEAYNYVRHWLSVDTSVAIMDLAMMSELPGMIDDESSSVLDNIIDATTTFSMTSSSSVIANHDLLEPPEHWMDGEMVYTSIGMVFEMAYLKCHLLCSLKRKRSGGGLLLSKALADDLTNRSNRCAIDDDDCVTADIKELTRQVALLLSVVHKWNPHLLPNFADTCDTIDKGDIVNEVVAMVNKKDTTIHRRTTPPAVATLLNVHPPGFELQYKMGNPGGGTIDEAVSVWQRNMILWHIVDPMTMEYLHHFCSRLDENLVNTSILNGSMRGSTTTTMTTMEKRKDNNKIDVNELKDAMISNVISSSDDEMLNEIKRNEAEELVRKLQEEKPERTMGQIMMHPDMAALMIKHLQTNS